MANLIRLRREGYVPARDVIVALTEHEENGDHNGIAWLLEKHRAPIDADSPSTSKAAAAAKAQSHC